MFFNVLYFDYDPHLNNFSGVVSDWALATICKNEGDMSLIRKKSGSATYWELIQYHCNIHPRESVHKSLGFKNVMKMCPITLPSSDPKD